jgi:parallel beta-helix repeat protein
VIDGLTVSGGGPNVVRGGATTEIAPSRTRYERDNFFHGGNGTVDHCTVQSNGGHGVVVEGASATVINSTISSNAFTGIVVSVSGARIGMIDKTSTPGTPSVTIKAAESLSPPVAAPTLAETPYRETAQTPALSSAILAS